MYSLSFSNLVQAAVSALQNQPIVNAVIDGDDIIYRDYIDISIAVGTPKVSLNSFLSELKFYLISQILRLVTFCWLNRYKFSMFNIHKVEKDLIDWKLRLLVSFVSN